MIKKILKDKTVLMLKRICCRKQRTCRTLDKLSIARVFGSTIYVSVKQFMHIVRKTTMNGLDDKGNEQRITYFEKFARTYT